MMPGVCNHETRKVESSPIVFELKESVGDFCVKHLSRVLVFSMLPACDSQKRRQRGSVLSLAE
jgi:hypothetical protein